MAKRRRTLKDLAADPSFISGVYNYCDRWCERCPLTARCLVFATEQQEDAQDPASRDITNRAFWSRMEGSLREAQEMLDELMREHGITLEPEDLAEGAERRRRQDQEMESHPCVIAGRAYGDAVDIWFKGAGPRFTARAAALESEVRMGLPGVDPEEEARRLRDATDVIRWYQHQIAVKLMRAVSSAGSGDEAEIDAESRDANGSAKVALIGVDRSLTAWAEMLRQMPEEEDRLLPILAALARLQRDIEAAFPSARAFVRPGFDTDETRAGRAVS